MTEGRSQSEVETRPTKPVSNLAKLVEQDSNQSCCLSLVKGGQPNPEDDQNWEPAADRHYTGDFFVLEAHDRGPIQPLRAVRLAQRTKDFLAGYKNSGDIKSANFLAIRRIEASGEDYGVDYEISVQFDTSHRGEGIRREVFRTAFHKFNQERRRERRSFPTRKDITWG